MHHNASNACGNGLWQLGFNTFNDKWLSKVLIISHSRFKKVISDGGSKETLVDYVQKELPKYETALKNLETLQGSCGIKKDFVDPRNEDPSSEPDIRSGIPKD